MIEDVGEYRAVLERLSRLCRERDLAVVDFLWNEAGFRLFGSETSDRADTRDGLVDHFETIFAAPYRIAFDWREVTVDRVGDIAWVCAEGDLLVIWPHETRPSPYRLVAVLEKTDGRWCWRLFDGSEPAPPPSF